MQVCNTYYQMSISIIYFTILGWNLIFSLNLHKSHNYLVPHVNVNKHSTKESKGSCRLRNNVQIDNRMDNSTGSEDSKDKKSCGKLRFSENVEESKNAERDNVFNVVLVRPANSLNIFINSSLNRETIRIGWINIENHRSFYDINRKSFSNIS